MATTAPSIEDAGFESRGSEEPQETIAPGQVGAFDSSGLGSFEALLGVGIVVEATVADQLGPEKFINDVGALGWRYSPPEAEDDAALWTTPYGTPMLVLEDLEVLLTVSGRPEAEAASDEIERAAQNGEKLEIGAPVGLYQVGSDTSSRSRRGGDERATPVEGAPLFVVAERAPSEQEPLMIIIDLEDTSGPTVRTGVTLQELSERTRDAMGLPPET